MNEFLVPLIIIAAAGVVIGFILGGLFSGMGRQTNKAASPPARDLAEVARLWRDRRRGGLVIEAGGRLFRSASDLNPTQHARLMQIYEALRAWLGLKEDSPIEIPPPVPSQAAPAHMAADALSLPARPPGFGPVDVLARAIASDAKTPVQPKSIAAQINEILQEKLEGSPLKSRAIRLMELPGKGMVVMIGLDQYAGVEAVPDGEIRDLIHQAVAEWERRVEADKKTS